MKWNDSVTIPLTCVELAFAMMVTLLSIAIGVVVVLLVVNPILDAIFGVGY